MPNNQLKSRSAPVGADPILSIDWMCGDLNCSRTTFYREHRARLPMVTISPRRRGARQSTYENYKRSLEQIDK